MKYEYVQIILFLLVDYLDLFLAKLRGNLHGLLPMNKSHTFHEKLVKSAYFVTHAFCTGYIRVFFKILRPIR